MTFCLFSKVKGMDMKMSKKYFISLLICAIIVLTTFIILYKLDNETIKKVTLNEYEHAGKQLQYYIDRIDTSNRYIIIEGWVIIKKRENNKINRVVLLEDSNQNYYKMNTIMKLRPDVTEYFNDGISYDKCGFVARVNRRSLRRENVYSIKLLCYDGEEIPYLIDIERSIRR